MTFRVERLAVDYHGHDTLIAQLGQETVANHRDSATHVVVGVVVRGERAIHVVDHLEEGHDRLPPLPGDLALGFTLDALLRAGELVVERVLGFGSRDGVSRQAAGALVGRGLFGATVAIRLTGRVRAVPMFVLERVYAATWTRGPWLLRGPGSSGAARFPTRSVDTPRTERVVDERRPEEVFEAARHVTNVSIPRARARRRPAREPW